MSLIDKCHKVAVEARGTGYLDNELTVYDAVTSYFLGLTGAYTFNWKQTRLYFGETLTILRVIGAHRPTPVPVQTPYDRHFDQPQRERTDYIKQEIGRRVFWVMFVGVRLV